MTTGKTLALTRRNFVGKVMSLLFNMLSRLVITFLPRSKRLLINYAAKSLQLCPTLCDPIDGSPPGSPVPGILQARIWEWVAISYSSGSSWPRNWTRVSWVSRQILYHCAIWEALNLYPINISFFPRIWNIVWHIWHPNYICNVISSKFLFIWLTSNHTMSTLIRYQLLHLKHRQAFCHWSFSLMPT